MNTELRVTPEIARIHAHICGDGHIERYHQRRSPKELLSHPRKKVIREIFSIVYTNTCSELLNSFKQDIKVSFNRTVFQKDYFLRITGTKVILTQLNLINKNSYNWNVPGFISESDELTKGSWLQAFFDDEATVDKKKKRIVIKSMHKAGLLQVQKMLYSLGIVSRVSGPNCDNSYYIKIYKAYLVLYQEKINFLHPLKKKKLDDIIWGRQDLNPDHEVPNPVS